MELRDPVAAAHLTELREARHLSPEQLSRAMFIGGHGYVAGRTIRDIESKHVVPTLRVRGVLSNYFEINSRDWWRNAPTFHDRRPKAAA